MQQKKGYAVAMKLKFCFRVNDACVLSGKDFDVSDERM
jgi:hypothetical protein